MLNSNLPTLDLHGETRDTARVLINEFIADSIKMGNYKICIVHGIGTGTIKKATHDALKKDARVERFYIDFFNIGCTIVEIKQM